MRTYIEVQLRMLDHFVAMEKHAISVQNACAVQYYHNKVEQYMAELEAYTVPRERCEVEKR